MKVQKETGEKTCFAFHISYNSYWHHDKPDKKVEVRFLNYAAVGVQLKNGWGDPKRAGRFGQGKGVMSVLVGAELETIKGFILEDRLSQLGEKAKQKKGQREAFSERSPLQQSLLFHWVLRPFSPGVEWKSHNDWRTKTRMHFLVVRRVGDFQLLLTV